MTFAYAVNGFTLVSERALPFLVPAPAGRETDIHVHFGPVPEVEGDVYFRVISPACVDINRPGALRIRAEDGCRLTVDAADTTTPGEIHTILFGAAFAALLYQRGRMPLHACAVRLGPDDAVAIAGASGAGKSTTALALLRAGHSLLCDDQIAFDPQTAMAEAGFPALKLWASALAHFGEGPGDAPMVVQGMDKYHVAAVQGFTPSPARLRAVCVLHRVPEGQEPLLTRLSGPEAVATLGLMSHHAYLAQAMGQQAAVFRASAALAARVPVFLLQRPVDFTRIGTVVERVLEAAAQ